VRRNVDTSDTCHDGPLIESALTLLVPWVGADNPHHAMTTNDLAVAAHFFDRSRNSHVLLL